MEEEEDYVGSLQCVCGSERVTVPLFGTAAVGKGDGGGGGGEQRRRPPPSSVPPPPLPRSVTSFPQTHRVTDIHTTYYTSNNASKGRGLLIE